MILIGTLLLQSILAPQAGVPDSLAVVTSSSARVAIAVERTESGTLPAVAVGPLALALDGLVNALPNSRFNFQVGSQVVELVDGLPFARSGDVVHPLAHAPRLKAGSLMVPTQFAREVLPSVLPEIRWDASTRLLHAPMRVASASEASPPASAESAQPDRRPPQRGTLSPVAGDPEPGGTTVLPTIRGEGARTGPPTYRSTAAASRGVNTPGNRQYTIVVDAGHGGVDNGMSGPIGRGAPRIYEKNITLAVSRLVAAELKDRGYRVIMTRTRDTLIALSDRGRIANREKGDLFLSIHVNAANPGWNNAGSARGYETYFLAEARTEDARRVEQMENDAVRFETESEVTAGDPLSFIVTDMQQNEHLRESKELAAAVQDHLSRIHPGPNRGVKQAAFRVLVTAFMPSVLIELGFGTNAAEARWLSDAAEQGRIATTVANAAEEYLAAFELRASGGQ
ncbi:MAG TPA: N-acetylmuramoyl-L-alanine amidase [Gemmatimonadales bacterium]|nr:N-acetylmuramoyl-L-alanine amidase [Gemmatimonadales bacterium]